MRPAVRIPFAPATRQRELPVPSGWDWRKPQVQFLSNRRIGFAPVLFFHDKKIQIQLTREPEESHGADAVVSGAV